MHMPLLLHYYCWQELVKSMWSKCIRPYTSGVYIFYIFIRNTHVCSFALSFLHFSHSRRSQHIWHAGTSAQYHLQWAPRGFPTWSWWIHKIGKGNVRGEARFSPLGTSSPGRSFHLPDAGAPVPNWLCSSHCPVRARQGLWQQAEAVMGDRDNYSLAGRETPTDRTLSSSSLSCPVAVTALEAKFTAALRIRFPNLFLKYFYLF